MAHTVACELSNLTVAGNAVDVAEVEFTPGDWPRHAWPLRYIALRFTLCQQELFESRASATTRW